MIAKIDERTAANMDVALDEAFAGVLHGGDHESRKYVAKKLIQSAGKGNVTLEGLRAVAREAFEQLSTRRSVRHLRQRDAISPPANRFRTGRPRAKTFSFLWNTSSAVRRRSAMAGAC